jgi:hypothetical protein
MMSKYKIIAQYISLVITLLVTPCVVVGHGGEVVQGQRLDVCDCEIASGDPQNLSCDKEGYFIGRFQRQGQWVMGGDPVPLSKAVCCRPCLPHEREYKDGLDSSEDRIVAVISAGCHASSDSSSSFHCEREGDGKTSKGFVVGFTDVARVFAPGEPTYYPIDSSECCTPSLLFESGRLLEVEPCDCVSPDDTGERVNCGAQSTNRLLTGFESFRIAPNGHTVPVGDASCCGMCVRANKSEPLDCSNLQNCNGRGSCILGRCECFRGWSGSTCAAPSGDGGYIPGWAVALIVIGSCLIGIIVLGILAYAFEMLLEWRESLAEENGDDEATQPLLIRIDRDDDGSVGSEDTEMDEEECSEVEQRIHLVEQDLNDGDDETEVAGHEPRVQEDDVQSTSAVAPLQPTGQDEIATDNNNNNNDESIDPDVVKSKLRAGHGPLANVLCNVCMDRPVQAVIVPCGHACMCRRCCRRLNRCPLCRTIIARRQKLYVL